MPFEQFAADNPSQIVMGLFNGSLIAVYLFHRTAPNTFQSHFTSRRDADKADVLAGAAQLVQWFRENDQQMTAFIRKRNTPLRRFVENAGMTQISPLQNDTEGCSLVSANETFVEYRS